MLDRGTNVTLIFEALGLERRSKEALVMSRGYSLLGFCAPSLTIESDW